MRHIVITISEIYLDRLEAVAECLRDEGVVVTHLYSFGVIIGIADESIIAIIRDWEEIASLTDEKEAKIPPPGADLQIYPDE